MRQTAENRECGTRYKFTPRRRSDRPRWFPEMDRLIHWCGVFDVEGLAPVEGGASAGNLSFRIPAGFVITPTRSRLKGGMRWDEFVEVVRADWLHWEIHYHGSGAPSSDSFLHERVYALRPDVNAVFHGHDDRILEAADALGRLLPINVTAEAGIFGTRLDAESTARDVGLGNFTIRKGHGFLAVGRTLDEAGEWALKVHNLAQSEPTVG